VSFAARCGALLMAAGWPSFLAACLLEWAVFAVADPLELSRAAALLGGSRMGVYTVAFFVFWAISLAACFLTAVLRNAPINFDSGSSKE
jgi:hypothetical protein